MSIHLGDLREVLNRPQDIETFAALCDMLDRTRHVMSEEELAYAMAHLARWPIEACTLECTRFTVEVARMQPWHKLVRGVHVSGVADLVDAHELACDWAYEHLGFSEISVTEEGVEHAWRSGLFEGLRSVACPGSALTPAACALLCRRLSEQGGVEHLGLSRSELGEAHLHALLASTLPGQLKSLDVSGNPDLGEQLCVHVARFERLERLDVSGCGLSDEAVTRLVEGAPSTLRHLSLHNNHTAGAQSWRALDERGLLACMVDQTRGVATLNLHGLRLSEDSMWRMMDAGLFDGLQKLDLTLSHLYGWAKVCERADFSSVHTFSEMTYQLGAGGREAMQEARNEMALRHYEGDLRFCASFEQALASLGELRTLRERSGSYYAEAELEAWLTSVCAQHVHTHTLRFRVGEGHALVERACATGMFEHAVTQGAATLYSPRAYLTTQPCMNQRAEVSTRWARHALSR